LVKILAELRRVKVILGFVLKNVDTATFAVRSRCSMPDPVDHDDSNCDNNENSQEPVANGSLESEILTGQEEGQENGLPGDLSAGLLGRYQAATSSVLSGRRTVNSQAPNLNPQYGASAYGIAITVPTTGNFPSIGSTLVSEVSP
jgi:hypothetical protein